MLAPCAPEAGFSATNSFRSAVTVWPNEYRRGWISFRRQEERNLSPTANVSLVAWLRSFPRIPRTGC